MPNSFGLPQIAFSSELGLCLKNATQPYSGVIGNQWSLLLFLNHSIAFGLQMLASLCCQPWGYKGSSALAEVVTEITCVGTGCAISNEQSRGYLFHFPLCFIHCSTAGRGIVLVTGISSKQHIIS